MHFVHLKKMDNLVLKKNKLINQKRNEKINQSINLQRNIVIIYNLSKKQSHYLIYVHQYNKSINAQI